MRVQKPAGVSLCMIVKNEERFLERCLASAADVVDEIIVVDTGSTDGTVEIAKRFGARVEHREWRDDFGWARNEAIALATRRWIFQLDADEELLPQSKPALRALKKLPADTVGVWIRCSNRSNQYRGGTGGVSHLVVRIFPNSPRIRYHGAIHEFPSLDGSEVTLPASPSEIAILHHGYLDEVVEGRSKYARNLAIIEKSTERNPGDPFNWYNLGVTAFLAGDYERCVSALLRMRDLSQGKKMRAFVPNGLTVLADALSDWLGRPEEGLIYAREALEAAPAYCNAHFSVGRALEDLKRYPEAREMFEAAIADGKHLHKHFVADEDVPVWKAQNCIAGTYILEGDDRNALRWLEEALRNSPNVQPPRHNIAGVFERLGDMERAEEAFRKLRDDFGDPVSCANYANFLLRAGKDREALAVVDADAERCGGEIAVAMYSAAAAVMQRNGWGDGEQYLLRARALAPEAQHVAQLLGAVYCARSQAAIAQSDVPRALEEAEKGIAVSPSDPAIRYNAAIACVNLGRRLDALVHLDCIDAANAGMYARAQFLRAVILRESGDPGGALEALARFEQAAGTNLDVTLMRGSLLEALGRGDEAEAVLRGALPLDKRRVAIELGGFYMRNGRFAEAQRVAEEALA